MFIASCRSCVDSEDVSLYICQAVLLLQGDKVVEKSEHFTIFISKEKAPLGNPPGNPIIKFPLILTSQVLCIVPDESEILVFAIGVSCLIFCVLLVTTFIVICLLVVSR